MNAEKLSLPAAIERLSQTVGLAHGLPEVDFVVTRTVSGEPLVIIESLVSGFDWANFLRLSPLVLNTVSGEIQFRGRVNGVQWAIVILPDQPVPYSLVDWDGPAHQTQLLPVVAS